MPFRLQDSFSKLICGHRAPFGSPLSSLACSWCTCWQMVQVMLILELLAEKITRFFFPLWSRFNKSYSVELSFFILPTMSHISSVTISISLSRTLLASIYSIYLFYEKRVKMCVMFIVKISLKYAIILKFFLMKILIYSGIAILNLEVMKNTH